MCFFSCVSNSVSLFLKQVPGFETYRNPTAQNLTTLLLTVGHLTVLRPVVSEAFVHILVNKRVTVLYEPFVLTLTARQCESPGSTGWLASPNCQNGKGTSEGLTQERVVHC